VDPGLVGDADGLLDGLGLLEPAKHELGDVGAGNRPARGVPETGQWSCCAFVFVDQAAEDIAAVDLFGGWRSRYALAL
jgi:hypothetical protein